MLRRRWRNDQETLVFCSLCVEKRTQKINNTGINIDDNHEDRGVKEWAEESTDVEYHIKQTIEGVQFTLDIWHMYVL